MNKLLGATLMSLAILTGCGSDEAKVGDTVVIDFAGFMNGTQFEGGTAANFPLKLGSGQFVPGFEEQLIGIKPGEEREIKITFPENYYPGLAGQSVIFKVKAVKIEK